MGRNYRFILMLMLTVFFGCGHTQSCKVGLMSFGDLEGKTIPVNVDGRILKGKDCGVQYSLSAAFHDALNQTEYDTLVDVEVINKTGFLLSSMCIFVEGKALNSKTLTDSGVR